MHIPHNAQPTVDLGDDPDPASELGPRLATTSQTVQGLLTNYLFYGQRRSSERAPAGVQRLAAERRHEAYDEDARSSITGRTYKAAGSQPADHRGVLASALESSPQPPGSQAEISEASRLKFVVRPVDVDSSEPSPRLTHTAHDDPLARDALTNDPLGQDQLRLKAAEASSRDRRRIRQDRMP